MPHKPKSHNPHPKVKVHEYRTDRDKRYRESIVGTDKETYKRLLSSQRWQSVRKRYLSRHPLCADPFRIHEQVGQSVPASQVHHRTPVREAFDLVYDASNLMSLCTECHSKIEQRDRAKRRES